MVGKGVDHNFRGEDKGIILANNINRPEMLRIQLERWIGYETLVLPSTC